MPVPPGYASGGARRSTPDGSDRRPRRAGLRVTCARHEPCPPAKRRSTTASPTTASACRRARGAELERRIRPVVATESVALAATHGRILAETVIAERDVPGFPAASPSPIATSPGRPTLLRLLEQRAAAGHPFRRRLPAGTALRVLTGAALPAGADTVLMQEDAALEQGAVIVPPGIRPGANRHRAGEDIRRGQAQLLQVGQRLRPQEVGVAAALGRARARVFCPVRVALLSTEDELASPAPPVAGRQRDQPLDPARAARRARLRVSDLGDRAAAVAGALREAAASHDVVLTSGGASRGDEDHVVRAVARQGRLHFGRSRSSPAGRSPSASSAAAGHRPARQPGRRGDLLPALRPPGAHSVGRRAPSPIRAFLVAGFAEEEAGSARVPARAADARADGAVPGRSRAKRSRHPDLAGRGRRLGRARGGQRRGRAGRAGRVRPASSASS